jgi:hypothetical protein
MCYALLFYEAMAHEQGPFGKWLASGNAGWCAVLGTAGDLVLVPAVGMALVRGRISDAVAGACAPRGPVANLVRAAVGADAVAQRHGVLPRLDSCGVAFPVSGVFFRFQLLFFTSLTTTFAVMLAVVLAGIALGGFGAARLLAYHTHAQVWLPLVSFGAGVALLLSYRWFPAVVEPAVRMSPSSGALVTTFALAFPVAFLSGVMFTLIGHAIHAAGYSDARATALLTIPNRQCL